ncbi:hypothetical protein BOX15_Mlig030773g2 [Macrostomum lignano]|uniref:PH domain-containing protein n=1 Tax=Macrostomum lignano TaxID=282301 RepID=A0A267F1J3_9PLAT|nr:hypothetical protein BOX15_Mlig030773g2 [Macrostomum lignano]
MEEGWELCILVEDLQLNRRIRVRGDTHLGGVMLKLIESIEVRMDWSDHAIWWPDENRWLLKTRRTLDQIGVQSDSRLEFLRMHNVTKVQLPDLQELEMTINYSQSVFGVVVGLCRELGIRHPEELSLRRPLHLLIANSAGSNGTLGSRFGSFRRYNRKSADKPELSNGGSGSGNFNPLMPRQFSETSRTSSSPRTPSSLGPPEASPTSFNSLRFQRDELASLANSPWIPLQTALLEKGVIRSKSLANLSAASEAWFDSSRSLMEQGVRPNSNELNSLQLRYKFHVFYDLNVKYDSVRINQIYEQTKWSLLSEELESTEEEALLLAALQLQIYLQADLPASPHAESPVSKSGSVLLDEADSKAKQASPSVDASGSNDDEIDAALAELEASLMSDNFLTLASPARLSSVPEEQPEKSKPVKQQQSLDKMPELAGYLKFLKPRKSTLRGYRRKYFVLGETTLEMYSDQARNRLEEVFNLQSAEVNANVSTTTQKFGIHLFVSDAGSQELDAPMQELLLRCEGKDQYAEWIAGITLVASGKTLASRSAFEAELSATLAQMELQTPKPQQRSRERNGQPSIDFDPENFLAQRHLKARKQSWLREQILIRLDNVRDRGLLDAKLDYIRICQRLPMYGVAHFLVQCTVGPQPERPAVVSFSDFKREKTAGKVELIGVASNRLMRLDSSTGQVIGAWRLEEICSWTINWELLSVQVRLARPPHELLLVPQPHDVARSASRLGLCKTLVEFLGGAAFLRLRQSDKSQRLDEQRFHQLTGTRDEAASR